MNTPQSSFFIALTLACSTLLPAQTQAAAGDLYVSALGSHAVIRFTPSGAGATAATGLVDPNGLAVDAKGTLYVSQLDGTIVKIVSGVGTPFASGFTNQSYLTLAFDKYGYLFVADFDGDAITKIAPDGTKTVFASAVDGPSGLAFDPFGNLFVAVHGSSPATGLIYKYASTGRTTFASAGLQNLQGLAFDAGGILYVADAAGSIYKYTASGIRSTFTTQVSAPRQMAFDSAGNLFVSDGAFTLSKVTPSGTRTDFAHPSGPYQIAFEPPLSQPLNISTLLKVQTGDNALFGGFITSGTAPKKVVIRAIGPSLSNFGVAGPLQDTTLELRAANGTLIASNDNWKINDQTHQSQEAAIRALGLAPTDDREAVIMAELGSSGFTTIVRGKNDTVGAGLVEIYDVNQAADSRLANISTRGYLDTAGSNITAGVIIGAGNGAAKVLVRVLGPSLAAFGIAEPLEDPLVDIRDSNGTRVAFNDDWKVREGNIIPQQDEIEATGLQPSNDTECAVIVTLPVGNFTAIAQSFGAAVDKTGVAVVEVYNLR
jgi:sugar lactone lactonase YvrE